MKRTKSLKIAISLLLISTLLLSACSSTNEPNSNSNQSGSKKVFKHAFTVPMDDAGGVGASALQKSIDADGIFTVNLFPAGQQGSMKEHWEGAQIGQLETIYAPGSALETFVPEVALLDLPYLFPDYETAWRIIDGELSGELNTLMNEKGFELLGIAPYGFNQFHTLDNQVNSVADLGGLKMRVIPSPLKIFQYEEWNANPTPIEFAELYTSLQSGVVDGGENALLVIRTQKLYEAQGHVTISDHSLFCGFLAANKEWYDSLSDDERASVDAAAKADIDAQRQFVIEEREKVIQELEDYDGMTVTYFTDEAKSEFAEKSKSTHEMYANQSDICRKLLDIVYDGLK